MVRLQKFLADAGVASRRASEEIILAGRVAVNGQTVQVLGTKIDPARDRVALDGTAIRPRRKLYLALNKPRGYICSRHDPSKRRTVGDLLPREWNNLYPVGRLDYDSEGLIFLTNDGDFTENMTRAGVIPKVYHVKLAADPVERDLERLRRGIFLDNERLAACEIQKIKSGPKPWYEVTLHQGRNQQIRRMFQVMGAPVDKLRRVKIGKLEDKSLHPGAWRFLSEHEVQGFQHAFSAKTTKRR